MEKPYKYIVICNKTSEIIMQTNTAPLLHQLQTWEETGTLGIRELKQTKTVYEDIRYKAKIRLFNYITFIKRGLPIPSYKPYSHTEIGKSIPILNF